MSYTANKVINDLEAKATPVDADVLVVGDSVDTNRAKKTTWSQVKTVLASTFGVIASPTFTGTVTTPAIIVSSETASTIASFDASKNIKSLALATYPSLTELSYVKGVTSALQTQIDAKAPSTAPTFATSITGSYLTASEMLITNGSKGIISAPVSTYPSLTELTYLKGVTSAIQTQINNISFSTKITLTASTVALSANGANTLISVSIPGGTLGTANAIRVRAYLVITNSGSANTIITYKYGATTLITGSTLVSTANELTGFIEFTLFANAATNAQYGSAICNLDYTSLQASTEPNNAHYVLSGTSAEDSTASKTLQIIVTQGDANVNCSAYGVTVEKIS